MKKILLSVLCILTALSFAACAQGVSGKAAWDKFYSALEITSALEYYSVKTEKSDKAGTSGGRLVLSSDSAGLTVAYREDGAARSWWVDGVAYTENGAVKTKKAQSINSFLSISTKPVEWSYDTVKNVKLNGKTVTFETSAAGGTVKVSAVIDGIFLSEITVFAEEAGTTLKYIYENAGQKPTVNLPTDLSEFIWEV